MDITSSIFRLTAALSAVVLCGSLAGCVPDVTTEEIASEFAEPDTAIYVSASAPDNSGDGTIGNPYRNIRYTLDNVAVAGDTVRVLPGTHNTGMGESFPINVYAGISLIGDETTFGSAIVVSGGAPNGGPNVTITVSNGAVLAGLTIIDPGGTITDHGIYISATNAVVRNNTVTGTAGYGLYINAGSNILIDGNRIVNNAALPTTTAFIITSLPTGVVVQNNVVTSNYTGARTDTTAVDFGLGNLGSVGNNIFACSTGPDFYTPLATGTIDVSGNWWTSTTPVYSSGGASVIYSTNYDYAGC